MKIKIWISIAMLGVFISTPRLLAQPATAPVATGDEYKFLPKGFRQTAKTLAATNATMKLVLKYLSEVRAGHPATNLPAGLTMADISNFRRILIVWRGTVPPRPINFYGQVLDENGQPVSGATAYFTWDGEITNRNMLSFEDVPEISTNVTVDGDGLFSFTNRTGTQLSVSVDKAGYYTSRRNRGVVFKYSGPNYESEFGTGKYFVPDPAHPVVYYLHRMGNCVSKLVTSQYGITESFGISVPKDGTSVQVDLLQRRTGNGPLEIRQTKPDYPAHGGIVSNLSPSDLAKLTSATNWSFGMKIKDGGFIEESDEFPFHPPESGYQAEVTYSFQKGKSDWTTGLHKEYYIKFGNPPVYGQLEVETSSDQKSVILWYVINPDGTRNLEVKQDYFYSSSHWRH